MTMVLLVFMALVAHLVVEKPGVSLGNSLVTALHLLTTHDTHEAAVASVARPGRMPGSFTRQSADRL
jgi:hypothetical protein